MREALIACRTKTRCGEQRLRRRGSIGIGICRTSLLKLNTGKLFALMNSMREELDGCRSGLKTAGRTHLGEEGPLVSSAKRGALPKIRETAIAPLAQLLHGFFLENCDT